MKAPRYFLAAVLLLSISLVAQNPKITKVEPPNWWIGLAHNPMLLVYGDGMEQASVKTSYPGVAIVKIDRQPNGHHLFVWLKIADTAKAGKVPFEVTDAHGTAKFFLELSARQSTQGRFQGISQNDVLYLVMPDRFADGNTANDNPPDSPGQTDRSQARKWHGGDITGVTQHLGYIHDLGATAVWLTPWWKQDPATSDYHGYGSVDFYAVDEHLGTMQDLQKMTAAAHAHGMKIILDYVPNHTGPGHPWANDPPTPTWLHGTPEEHPKFDWHFEQLIDPHATARMWRGVVDGWFADKLPDINGDDPHAAEYLIDNAIWWTESTGLDAYRLDTFPYSSLKFWNVWHTAMFATYPHSWSVGEVLNEDPWITSYFVGGQMRPKVDTKLTTVFDFPSEFALRKVFGEGASLKTWVQVLQHDDLFARPEGLVTLIGNHDHSRFASLKGMTVQKFNAAVALQLTMRGVPQIYSGDEIYMPGGNDPDNRRDFPGGFAGDSRNAFTAAGRTPDEQSTFANMQALLKLRSEHEALRTGKMFHLLVADDAYGFARQAGGDTVIVVYNDSESARTLTLPLEDTPLVGLKSAAAIFGTGTAQLNGRELQVQLPAQAVGIFKAEVAAVQ